MTASIGEVGPGLERRALGFVPVLFQSIVFAGPAVGVALSLVFLASYAGGATPLATILTTLAILLIAVSIGELGSKLPSAGGLYTYVAAGMGEGWGFMLSWLLVAAYLIIDAGLIALLLGLIVQDNLTSQLGAPSWLWAPIVVFCICVAAGLVVSGIRPSAKVQVVMGVFEMAVFSVLSFWLIIKAGSRNTLSVFSPTNGNANGWGSIFAAMIYGVLAFAGFESAAFLAEEAREPRRAVRRAVIGSVVVIGIFWTLTVYAGVVYWGPHKITLGKDTFVAYNSGDPWDGIAHVVWGGAWVLVLIAVINSTWASLIGEFNAASRVAFALGRVKLLSPHAASIHRKLRTPWIAAIGLAVIAIAVSLSFGFAMSGPKPMGATLFLGALVTLLFIPIYMLVALSCLFYFWRHHRDEFSVIKHGVLPVVGVAFFVPVLIASLGINFAGLGIAPLTGDARYAPWIVLVWIALGIVVYAWLRLRRPETIGQLDRVFIVEEHAALRRVATVAAEGAHAESLFAVVAEQVGEVLRVPLVSIVRYERDGTATERASFSRVEGRLRAGTRWSLEGTNVVDEVLRSGHPARVDDYGGLAGEIAEAVRRAGVRSTVGIPIVVAGRLWGAMVVSSTEPDPLHEDTEARLTNFTELVATAIANGEAREQVERLAEEQASLRRVATLVAHGARPAEVFSAVSDEVARLINCEAAITRYEPDGSGFVIVGASDGFRGASIRERYEHADSLASTRVYRTGKPARNDDIDPERAEGPGGDVIREMSLVSTVGAPIVVEDSLWGALIVADASQRLAADTEGRVERFTELVATAIANAESRDALARLAEEQAALRRVATLIARAASAEEVFSAVAEEVASVLGLRVVTVCRYEVDAVVVLSSLGIPAFPAGSRWPLDDPNLPGSVYRTGGPVRIDDLTDDLSGAVGIYAMAHDGSVKSALGAPIVVDGAVWGSVNAASTEERAFPADAEERLARFTDLVATSVQNATMRDQLAASRARVIAAADESRRRIERDLHDGAQQQLVTLALDLRMAEAKIPSGMDELRADVGGVAQGLNDAMQELREMSQGIHPAVLTLRGLSPALETLGLRSAVEVELDVRCEQRLPDRVEVAAYYTVAEALTNASKHSGATRAWVSVRKQDGALQLSVRDDGAGGADPTQGTGLIGLRDRVEALGGTIEIDSPPGRGTRIDVAIPVSPPSG